MPSKSQPRKKRSLVKLPAAAVLWALAILNVAVGLQHSSLTKAYRIRVVGVESGDERRIEAILGGLRGVPSRQVNVRKIESEVLENDRLESATYAQNIFGRGLLKLTHSGYVARLRGVQLLCLTKQGSIVKVQKEYPGLPELKIPASASMPSGLLFAPYEAGRMAELCMGLKKQFPVTPWILEVRERGELSLYSGTRGEVRLGSSMKLQEKLSKLKQLLVADPELLNRQDALNLTVPDAPTMDPRGRRTSNQP